jgi:hypothetical protein
MPTAVAVGPTAGLRRAPFGSDFGELSRVEPQGRRQSCRGPLGRGLAIHDLFGVELRHALIYALVREPTAPCSPRQPAKQPIDVGQTRSVAGKCTRLVNGAARMLRMSADPVSCCVTSCRDFLSGARRGVPKEAGVPRRSRRLEACLLAAGFCIAIAGCGKQSWSESDYPGGITFRATSSAAGGLYDWVIWDRRQEKPGAPCPIKIEMEGKVWTADDLKLENFLNAGATDNLAETEKALGHKMNDSNNNRYLLPSCSYRDPRINASINCLYDHDKLLRNVEVRFSGPASGTVKITTPQGEVELPTSHKNLVKQLGPPQEHQTGRNA